MNKMTSKELRKAWLDFYKERGHVDIGAASLIGDGTTGVMFNVAGMQPLMPYLLGKEHPMGTRLCNIQGCIRTNDIESVGDASHSTFFEMMGSWSLGDYFKEDRIKWTYELLTDVFDFPMDRIATTGFEVNDLVEADTETVKLKEEAGFLPENIFLLPKSENWWELDRGPCGPDSEIFYITDVPACGPDCSPACDCGHYVEIGNDVFMQYDRVADDKYVLLDKKNVDTGWGFERILAFLNESGDVYQTDLFTGAMKILEQASGKKYNEEAESTFSMRVIADHVRTSVMLIGDKQHLVPSNVGAGYILRRLIRRAVRHAKKLNLSTDVFTELATHFIDDVYGDYYTNLVESKDFILNELTKEINKFEKTLNQGIKEFNKVLARIEGQDTRMLDGETSFRLYDTYGFPIELTEELAKDHGLTVDMEGFKQKFKEHQEKSRTAATGSFKGGLQSTGEMEVKYHTATHLLNAALKLVIGPEVHQRGSNITAERLRFDFNCDHKLTPEEKQQTEEIVNQWIAEDLPVSYETMSKDQALKSGAECMFIEKYPDEVKVYSIGEISKELCGGPHVEHTGVLGKFKIKKEESSSAGVRRIKAILREE